MAEVNANPGVTQESMAQGTNGTVAPVATPSQVRTPTPTPATGTPGTQGQQGQTQDSFWSGDVNSLSPEGQAVYKQLYGDYTRKRQEETNRLKEVQSKLDQYEREVKQYSNDKTEWQKWQPILQRLAVPNVWNQVEQILTGRQQPAQTQGVQRQPGETTQQAVSRYIENLQGDDFLTPQHFDRGLDKFEETYTQRIMQNMQQQAQQYFQQIMQYVNGMQTLYDQALELKLQNYYGMKPQEGVEFNLNDVIQTARELGIGDLQAAYKIKYGEANARRAAEMQAQQQQKTLEQIRAEEYQRGLKEGQLVAHNANSGFIPSVPNLPKFEAKKNLDGYSNVENILRDKLMQTGVR